VSLDFTGIESRKFETSVSKQSETYFLVRREMTDGRAEPEKDVEEIGGPKTELFDLKSSAGTPC